MKIEITLHQIDIRDRASGDTFVFKTLRTAREVYEEIEQSEKDHALCVLQEKVSEAYGREN